MLAATSDERMGEFGLHGEPYECIYEYLARRGVSDHGYRDGALHRAIRENGIGRNVYHPVCDSRGTIRVRENGPKGGEAWKRTS